PTHISAGENYATFNITTDAATQPVTSVAVAGLAAANYQTDNEPALAEIARIFGWQTFIGSESNRLNGDSVALGEEVYAPFWLRARINQPVLIWPIAIYSSDTAELHGYTRFQARPGTGGNSGLLYSFAGTLDDDNILGSNDASGGENQKLLAKIFSGNASRTPTTNLVDFIPTQAFALSNDSAQTDDSRNGAEKVHNWRIYPLRDQAGQLLPHSYFAAKDNGNTTDSSTGKNFDFNDYVFLVTNIRPQAASLAPRERDDFSGEGSVDLLLRNYQTGENVLWLLNGPVYQASALLPTTLDFNWEPGGTGDFTGDGRPEILWRNYSTGENAAWVVTDLAYQESLPLPALAPAWRMSGSADLDQDGNVDILWRNYSTGENAVWLMDGLNLRQSATLLSVTDLNWQLVGGADLDRDGNVDLLWRNYGTGENAVWLMQGLTYRTSALLLSVNDPDWQWAGSGDFDRDGKHDLVWRNNSTGENALWLMNDLTYRESVLLPSLPDTWRIEGPQ
ncbi:VCBS repeat-containing protein, partial [Candidatus Cyanaurora vandensis]